MQKFGLGLCFILMAAGGFETVAATVFNAKTITHLKATSVGGKIELDALPISTTATAKVRLKRIDVYAPDTKIWVIDSSGQHEIPRSHWLHFIADKTQPGAPRLGLSIDPLGKEIQGVLYANDGQTYAIDRIGEGKAAGTLRLRSTRTSPEGELTDFVCQNAAYGENLQAPPGWQDAFSISEDTKEDTKQVMQSKLATRQAVIAIDTDNELLAQKFADNATNANNYLAALFTAINVIYERDLDLTLVQGNTTLRLSGVADPYPSAQGSSIITQLNEFGEYWRVNNAAVNRAFVAQISGKASAGNSSAGVAWLINSGNYCTTKGTLLPAGAGTYGHYSVSRVFKFGGATAADDVQVVAHELGHNFGLNHTHCTSNLDGTQPANANTIDQCFNDEAASGCYAGGEACPAGGSGTLMSYCHLSSVACNVSEEFHPVQEGVLLTRITENIGFGCITPSAPPANQAPNISRPASIAVNEDTVTSLNGISFSDVDAGVGILNVTLSVPPASGTIASVGSGVVTVASGSGTDTLELTGTLANLNSYFANAVSNPNYTPALNATGAVMLAIEINDNGNTGAGGPMIDSDSLTLNISPINDAPVNSFPPSFTVIEDITTSLDGMSVNDDSGTSSITFNLLVANGSGTFTAANTGGVTVAGNGSNSLTLTGNVANLAAYLANPANNPNYVPVLNNTATVNLTITSNDGGATGGGALLDVDQRQINFTSVNDAPSLSAPEALAFTLVGNTPITGIVLSDVDAAIGNMDVVLSVNQGVLLAANNDGVTVVSGNNTATLTLLGARTSLNTFFSNQRVSFNPNGATSTTTLNINCDDNGHTGGGALSCPQATITLGPILFSNGFE